MIDFDRHMQKFLSYVQQFESTDPRDRENITLKKDHSLRVYQEANRLTQYQVSSRENIQLSRLTALYHDIGRFPQYHRYGSFNDRVTVNHGLMGYKTLRNEAFLSSLTFEIRKKVFFGVLNHNRAKIPKSLPEDYCFILKVVRDSDKLDIINVLMEYFASENSDNDVVTLGLNSDRSQYSEKVIGNLLSCSSVNYQDLIWINDFKLMLLSWIYDLNFQYTRQEVINRRYLEKLFCLLPNTADIQKVEKKIFGFLEDIRISGNVS